MSMLSAILHRIAPACLAAVLVAVAAAPAGAADALRIQDIQVRVKDVATVRGAGSEAAWSATAMPPPPAEAASTMATATPITTDFDMRAPATWEHLATLRPINAAGMGRVLMIDCGTQPEPRL